MLFGINTLYIWLAVIVLCVVIEALTLDLCAIWFAVGGVAALVAASLSLEVVTQLSSLCCFPRCCLSLCGRFAGVSSKQKKSRRMPTVSLGKLLM